MIINYIFSYGIFICAFGIIVFVFFLIISAYKRNYHSINQKTTLKDLNKFSFDKPEPVDIFSLELIPNAEIKRFQRYSTSLQTYIEIKNNDSLLIKAVANGDIFNLAVWKTGTAAGYIGSSSFLIIRNLLGSRVYIDEEYLGYIPRVYAFYFYGFMRLFRRNLLDKSDKRIVKYSSNDTIAVKSRSIAVAGNLDESVANQSPVNIKNESGAVISFFDYDNGRILAKNIIRPSSVNVSADSYLQFIDNNLSREQKLLIIMRFIQTQLSF